LGGYTNNPYNGYKLTQLGLISKRPIAKMQKMQKIQKIQKIGKIQALLGERQLARPDGLPLSARLFEQLPELLTKPRAQAKLELITAT